MNNSIISQPGFDIRWMSLAVEYARSNEGTKRAKMAALVVNRSKLITVGLNQYKTHPLQAKFGKNEKAISMHAEINALVKFLRLHEVDDLASCDMYIARVTRSNDPVLAKPCKGCQTAIMEFGVQNVYWTE